jgi:hypothetical protein
MFVIQKRAAAIVAPQTLVGDARTAAMVQWLPIARR